MSSSQWSLDTELKQLTGQEDLTGWLRSLSLIEAQDSFAYTETIRDWYRSGAETYGLRFALVTTSGKQVEAFMKACVAYSGGVPLKDIFAKWMSRRTLVEKIGVHTPRLYGVGAALLVEEYVPYTLTEAAFLPENRPQILRSIGRTAGHLVNAGFTPLSAHDWRSRGADVVLVDFGQDLGPPNIAGGGESGLLSEVLDNLAAAKISLSVSEIKTIGSAYEQALDD